MASRVGASRAARKPGQICATAAVWLLGGVGVPGGARADDATAPAPPRPPPRLQLVIDQDGRCRQDGNGVMGLWFRLDVADGILRKLEEGEVRSRELDLQVRKAGELAGQLAVRAEQAELDRRSIDGLTRVTQDQAVELQRVTTERDAMQRTWWWPWALLGAVSGIAIVTLAVTGQ